MQVDYIKPRVYAMLQNQLADFVHNRAQAGDVATSFDSTTDQRYIYFCTPNNIGRDINPVWMLVDKRGMLKSMFENMTLEQKVDFLIDEYIQNNS